MSKVEEKPQNGGYAKLHKPVSLFNSDKIISA